MLRYFPIFIIFLFGFFCNAQEYNSLVFSEIMADPVPAVGLPEVEYIEIYNRSGKAVSLKGWKFMAGARASVLPDSIILPGSYAIICQRNNVSALAIYGKVIGLSSFSLTNEAMSLALYNAANKLVYAIFYLNKWWSSDKNKGGFSLEMADLANPCGEVENWFASLDHNGGTPGRRNSIEKTIRNTEPPFVERVDVMESGEILVVFDKRMDSLSIVGGSTIELAGRTIIKKQLELPSFHNLRLTPDTPLLKEQRYQLSIHNAADCSGNLLRESLHQIGVPAHADSGDVVVNEILFNPRNEGVDFVELYNRSSKFVNLKNWAIGNVKSDGTSSFTAITSTDLIISPNSYLAITTDVALLKEQYPSYKQADFFETSSLPSFPNTEGGVMLKSAGSEIFDRFLYFENMHHELLSDYEGVSLEKINSDVSSLERSNWQSASSTTGYATPGYANSQKKPEISEDYFTINPEAITPDNDGQDDYTVIKYKQSTVASIATLSIFSISGRLVKNLLRNQLMGTNGEIRWDGTDENSQFVPTGYYFVLITCFDTLGKTWQYKKRIVVARRNG